MSEASERQRPDAHASIRWLFPPAWPLIWLLVGYPIWWVIGVAAFMPAVLSIPLAWHLARSRPLQFPRTFWIWVFLLAWVGLSATQLRSFTDTLSYAYRGSYYVFAGLTFLYVAQLWRVHGQISSLVRGMTIFWMALILLGVLAQFLPRLNFPSLIEPLVPVDMLRNDLLRGLVHPRLANVQEVIGQAIARPAAPFPFTNWWGGNVAALLPFVLLDASTTKSLRWRRLLIAALVLAVIPIVLSLNRGMWLSLVVGTGAFVLLHPDRSALQRRLASGVSASWRDLRRQLTQPGASTIVRWGLLLAIVAVGLVLAAVLVNVTIARLTGTGSAGFRVSFTARTLGLVLDSPLLGYGVPRAAGNLAVRLGTQGQLWLLLFTAGIPALIAFGAWLVASLRAAVIRRRSATALCGGLVILIIAVQLPFYNIINMELVTFMVAAAFVWSAPASSPFEAQTDQ